MKAWLKIARLQFFLMSWIADSLGAVCAGTIAHAKVRAEDRLSSIDGNRFIFHVVAFQGLQKLAEGENGQIVVSLEVFKRRVAKKTVIRDSIWGES